jgi:hypothetical protein
MRRASCITFHLFRCVAEVSDLFRMSLNSSEIILQNVKEKKNVGWILGRISKLTILRHCNGKYFSSYFFRTFHSIGIVVGNIYHVLKFLWYVMMCIYIYIYIYIYTTV